MTSRTLGGPGAGGSRARRLTGLPREVAHLSGELSALRSDVAQLRQDVGDLGRLQSASGS